ncbi:MAG: LamG-like jellyroll fold domain-containing protein [Candidatus Micrarchaeota archaeon]
MAYGGKLFWLMVTSLVLIGYFLRGDLELARVPASRAVVLSEQYGLAGYWMMDEGTGIAAFDSSGNGNTGQLRNTPLWVGGKFGSSLQFDGNGINYKNVYIPHSTSLATPNAVTVSAWVYPLGISGDHQVVLAKWYDENSNFIGSFVLELQPNGVTPQFVVRRAGDLLVQTAVSNVNIPVGQWYYVTGTYDGTTIKIYVNGALTGTVSMSGTINQGNQPVIIGAHSYSSIEDVNIFNGIIDDVKLFNRALSFEEVNAEFIKGAISCTVPTAGLVVSTDTVLCPGTFILPFGINITASNIKVICHNTVLQRQELSDPSSAIYIHPGLSNILVYGCEFKDFSSGIYASGAGSGQNNIRILDNKMSNVAQGVYFRNADNIEVGYNIVGAFAVGFGFYNTRDSTWSSALNIHDNSIAVSGSGAGINVEFTGSSYIERNTIAGGDYGINLYMSSENFVRRNSVDYTRSGGSGLSLIGASSYNIIEANNFRHNNYGIYAVNIQFPPSPVFYISDYNNFSENNITDNWFGAEIARSSLPGTINNKAWYNNFERNTNWQASSLGPFNTTIAGKGRGNYYDDIGGLCIFDGNGDGYGDYGPQYPYRQSNGARADVVDYAPKTSKTPICGDNCCYGGETCTSCPGDCGSCGPVCGDGLCNNGESCSSCSSDCGSCGPPSCRYYKKIRGYICS